MSDFVLPILVLIIIISGLIKKINIYEVFIKGAKESFSMIINLFPWLLAMIFGINIFINCGVLDLFARFFSFIHLPPQLFSLFLVRPISGGASLAITSNILSTFGPDSYIGRLASVMQGSSDTTLYVITLYFGTVGITKIRYALASGLIADAIGIIVSILVVKLMFWCYCKKCN